MAHTKDLVDLAWTTRQDSTDSAESETTIRFRANAVTATARTDRATDVLAQHGFTPAKTAQEYTLPAQHSEVWPLPTSADWRYYDYEQDDETARHPSGSLVLSRHRPGTTPADSWTAEAAVHLGTYFWSAELHGCAPAPRHRVRHRPDPLGTRSESQGRGP